MEKTKDNIENISGFLKEIQTLKEENEKLKELTLRLQTKIQTIIGVLKI